MYMICVVFYNCTNTLRFSFGFNYYIFIDQFQIIDVDKNMLSHYV